MKFALQVALLMAFFAVTEEYVYGEAVPLDSGSFVSPDCHFALQLSPAKYGYTADIKDCRSGKITDSVLAVPATVISSRGQEVLNSDNRETSQRFDFQTAIYRVDWTGDSRTFAVIYHVADGSAASLFHFDGKAWHQIDLGPTPGFPKCPYEDSTEQYDNSPPIHFHGPSFTETIFDEKAALHTVWISFGVETDQSHRHSHFYVCNFDFDPVSQKLSNIELRMVSIPEFLRLRARRDYSRSMYPRLGDMQMLDGALKRAKALIPDLFAEN